MSDRESLAWLKLGATIIGALVGGFWIFFQTYSTAVSWDAPFYAAISCALAVSLGFNRLIFWIGERSVK